MMVLGLGSICSCLSILAVRLKRKNAVILFVLSFLASMCIGYLANHDSAQTIEQGIYCISQGALLMGTLFLHKAGLKEYTFTK